ncbi:hypothetical protein VNI00_005800 [Paramarasmius palmivorus]|uniref:Uncharacterized protein n=1 Tax=Paramarasmius palmivorus TaxID=297713 RepID=A0AAW0DDR8_9AGAR
MSEAQDHAVEPFRDTVDYANLFPPIDRTWNLDTVVEAVRSINFIVDADYSWERHRCAPCLIECSQESTPPKRYYVMMDYIAPPREHCANVHEGAFDLVEHIKEINRDEALHNALVHLEQFKARVLVHEVKKLFPMIVEGKVGMPDLWNHHAQLQRMGQEPGSTNRNPLMETEKRRIMLPATSHENNTVSFNMQAANPTPKLGTLPSADSQQQALPIWSGWRFWIVTPEKEEEFNSLKRAYWAMWEHRQLLTEANMFVTKSATEARRGYIRIHSK